MSQTEWEIFHAECDEYGDFVDVLAVNVTEKQYKLQHSLCVIDTKSNLRGESILKQAEMSKQGIGHVLVDGIFEILLDGLKDRGYVEL